jgi:hypothetical protein
MALSDRAKKIIGIVLIVCVLAIVITVIVLLVRKKNGASSSNAVTFQVKGPKFDKTETVNISLSRLKNMNIGELMQSTIQTSTMLPWKSMSVYWDSISINNKPVDLTDGYLSERIFATKLLTFFNNTIPGKVIILGVMKHTCSNDEKETIGKQCDPCKGQAPVCTEQGWVCKDNQLCPDADILKTCCVNSVLGPVASCDPNSKVITCGTCPDPPIDCGSPGCDAVGPVCTADGWSCQKGVLCPTGHDLGQCCSESGKYAVCQNGHVQCTNCKTDNLPKCDPDCDNSALVCHEDGTWKCEKGRKCPPQDVQNKCCKDGNFPECKDGDAKVTCTDCNKLTPLTEADCPPSCNGQGPKCVREDGVIKWKCVPNMKCPIGSYLNNLNCCPNDFEPVCTEDNCISCKCPRGQFGCGPTPPCSEGSSRSATCCENGEPCNQDPITKKWMCCAPEQVCLNGCCPAETVCKNGDCVAKCGVDSTTGEPYTCAIGQMCVMIENATPQQWTRIKSQNRDARKDEKANIIYLCADIDKKCRFSVDEEVAVPSAINNYYPCYSFPSLDQDHPAGYCIGRIEGDNEACNKYGKKGDCNDDGKCEWRDVLSYMAEGKDGNDLQKRASQIQKDMGYIQNNWNGNFCYPQDQAYQRIIAFSGSGVCDWQDCVSQIAQPGIIDVEFNENTKSCIGLQACNNYGGVGMSNKIKGNMGISYDNPDVVGTKGHGNLDSFPSCANATCDLGTKTDKYICSVESGMIENPPVWVVDSALGSGPKTTCVKVSNPSPTDEESGAKDRLSCYAHACSKTDCCLSGYEFNGTTAKCYIKQPKKFNPCAHSKLDSCSLGKGRCSGTDGGWGSHAYGDCSRSCHPRCYAGNGIVKPDNDRGNIIEMGKHGQISHDRPYCICGYNEGKTASNENKKWRNWKDGQLVTYTDYDAANPSKLEAGYTYFCEPGKNDQLCTATY